MSRVFKAGQVREDREFVQILEGRVKKGLASELYLDDVSLDPELLEGLPPELSRRLSEHYLRIIYKGRKHLNAARAEAEKIKREAREYLEEVREQANAELAASQEEIQALRRKAVEEGREEGRAAGREEGLAEIREEFAETLVSLQQLHQDYQARMQEMYRALDEVVVQLSLNLAEKIIGCKLELEPELLVEQIEQVLRKLTRVTELVIRVNPEDYQYINPRSRKFAPYIQGEGGVRVIKDGQVKRGGFVLETPDGGIDGRLETRLEVLEKRVREVVSNAAESKRKTDKGHRGVK